MAILDRTFTWWNGATWGTWLFTRLRGEEVGRDDSGNIYYRHRKDGRRRWVVYPADNDGSRVPPGWQLWLKGTIDDLPDKELPPKRPFEKPAQPNLTGTMAAFRPDGSLSGGGVRPASTGDYEAWTPD
jgi:NADH:ubiquinone oxidoreductase subunit